MLASITLVPALFALFGRRSFWPKVPRVGEETVKSNLAWSRIGRFVTKKPAISAAAIGIILLASALNMMNMKYEFDTIKSFPEDMPSRVGYEILEEKFEKGNLAPTTVLFESDEPITREQKADLLGSLEEQPLSAVSARMAQQLMKKWFNIALHLPRVRMLWKQWML